MVILLIIIDKRKCFFLASNLFVSVACRSLFKQQLCKSWFILLTKLLKLPSVLPIIESREKCKNNSTCDASVANFREPVCPANQPMPSNK